LVIKDGLTINYLGDKCWYLHGNLHREDGPAIEYANGTKYWYLDGKPVNVQTQEQFLRMMKMKVFW
jgi:hypothetical protein